jgi:hypothetical protein
MRAVVVAIFGRRSASEPSFAVLAVRTVGHVFPPSVEREIFTLAQLTGDAVVLATFHVIVFVVPPVHVTAVLGDVTWNGPDVLVTVTVMSVYWV